MKKKIFIVVIITLFALGAYHNYEVSIGSGSFCKVDEIEVKSETKLLAAYIAVISFIILFNELPQNG